MTIRGTRRGLLRDRDRCAEQHERGYERCFFHGLPPRSDRRPYSDLAAVGENELTSGSGVRVRVTGVESANRHLIAGLYRARFEAAADEGTRSARLETPLLDSSIRTCHVEEEPRVRILQPHRRDHALDGYGLVGIEFSGEGM